MKKFQSPSPLTASARRIRFVVAEEAFGSEAGETDDVSRVDETVDAAKVPVDADGGMMEVLQGGHHIRDEGKLAEEKKNTIFSKRKTSLVKE